MKTRNEKITRWIPVIIIVLGILLRFFYTYTTDCLYRSHDLGDCTPESFGKAGYILYIFSNNNLPDSYTEEYYQQPLFYLLGALVAKVANRFFGFFNWHELVDSSKWVSFFASCLTLVCLPGLCDEFEIDKQRKTLAYIFISFCPALILASGRVGEEALLFLFMTIALWFTIRWDKNPSFFNTVVLALSYGLGMMTKVSMAVLALFTAFIMIRKVWINRKEHAFQNITKILMFGIISVPLGLWFNVRNYIKLGQPIGYVMPQDPNGPLFRGMIPLWKRFLIPDIKTVVSTPYASAYGDYNLPTYLLKTEMFGEFNYPVPDWICYLLLLVHTLITLYLIYLISIKWWGRKGERVDRYIMVIFGVDILFAAFSYFKYPFGCTMDYRYFAFATFMKGLFAARYFTHKWEKAAVYLLGVLEIVFMLLVCINAYPKVVI